MLEVRTVLDERELEQILDLQRKNLPRNLPPDEIAQQGFVTVQHTLEALRGMHALAPSIVAVEGGALLGYALVMPRECRVTLSVGTARTTRTNVRENALVTKFLLRK